MRMAEYFDAEDNEQPQLKPQPKKKELWPTYYSRDVQILAARALGIFVSLTDFSSRAIRSIEAAEVAERLGVASDHPTFREALKFLTSSKREANTLGIAYAKPRNVHPYLYKEIAGGSDRYFIHPYPILS